MRFKLVESIDENFENEDKRLRHWTDHGRGARSKFKPPFKTDIDYEDAANLFVALNWKKAGLARSDTDRYVGYINRENHYILYDYDTNIMASFKPTDNEYNPLIYTYMVISPNTYRSTIDNDVNANRRFKDEFPHNREEAERIKKEKKEEEERKRIEAVKAEIQAKKDANREKYLQKQAKRKNKPSGKGKK